MGEIRVQDEQGNIHVFPDGSTPEMISKVMNVKPPSESPAPAAQPGFFQRMGLVPDPNKNGAGVGDSEMEGGLGDAVISGMGQISKRLGAAYVKAGPGQVASGIGDIAGGQIKQGANKAFSGAGTTLAPLLPEAAVAYPLPFLRAALGSVAGSKIASIGYGYFKPEDKAGQDLAGNVGGVAGGALANPAYNVLAKMFPSTKNAGALFNQVMSKAADIPVDISKPGNTALAIDKLARSGGQRPKVINDFINRTTQPDSQPLTYAEARDFYSNASRVSADESNKLTPNMKRMLGQFRDDLGSAISDAAGKANEQATYQQAMNEYRQASKLKDVGDFIRDVGAKNIAKGIGTGLGTGAGGAVAYHLLKKK